MAMTAGQFFLYLLIIIILRESLASATSPISEAAPSCTRVSTIPAVDTGAHSRFDQLHGFQTMKDFLEVEVHIEGAHDCEPNLHMQRLVKRLKCTSSSLRINFRSPSW